MSKRILMIGAFDTKGAEYAFLREQIVAQGGTVLSLNTGVMGAADRFRIDIDADEVARAGGGNLHALREARDRGQAMKTMSAGAANIVRQLHEQGRFDGIIGMGGSGGTSVITAAMRNLPIGVPKLCVSTVAGSDTGPYVGVKDIMLLPSITDVAGVNRISKMIISRAAGAICGMVEVDWPDTTEDRPIIVASMFGNTTECVDACRVGLEAAGYEVLVFHATGTGGRTMESLVDEGLVDGCLDITTTEWADQICGGIFAAGENRLTAAGRTGVPHLIAPGCVDMVNFGPLDTVPAKYLDVNRVFYEWNPSITLMRTNVEENRQMGKIFADKANASIGPVAFLFPLRGVSILDGDGERFCDRQADQALLTTLKENLRAHIRLEEVDANINDALFAAKAVEMMLDLIRQAETLSSAKCV